jgi:hypothetical protein
MKRKTDSPIAMVQRRREMASKRKRNSRQNQTQQQRDTEQRENTASHVQERLRRTPEQAEAIRAQNTASHVQERHRRTPEQAEAIRAQNTASHVQERHRRTPEQAAAIRAQNTASHVQERHRRTPEQAMSTRNSNALCHEISRSQLTDEENENQRQRRRIAYHGLGDTSVGIELYDERNVAARHNAAIQLDILDEENPQHRHPDLIEELDVADNFILLNQRIKDSVKKVKNERKLREVNNDVLRGQGCAVKFDLDSLQEDHVSEHYCGKMSHSCPYCGARFWALESTIKGVFTQCCKSGTIKLAPLAPPTPKVERLLIANDPTSKAMRSNLRTINSNISFTSIQMRGSHLPGSPSVPFFRIQGSPIHYLGALNAAANETPSYMQCFFLESNSNGITDRTGRIQDNNGREVLRAIHDEVRQYNPFFINVKSKIEEIPDNEPNYHIVISDSAPPNSGTRTYNAPTAIEVGGVIIGEPGVSQPRQVTIHSRSDPPPNHLKSISSKHPSYDPLSYALLHMRACSGWFIGMFCHKFNTRLGVWEENRASKLTVLAFYRYRAHCRDPPWQRDNPTSYRIVKDVLFFAALLTHQYWVDQFCKIEENNLDWVFHHQGTIRAAQYNGLADAVAQGEENQEGRRILPPSHVGSPRHQNECYQNAMARYRK